MRLEKLFIDRFRCVSRLEVELPPGCILIEGDNAQGKTTVLEAVFYLVTGRSFRTRYDNDCVPWRSETGAQCAIRGTVRRAAGDTCRLAVTIGAGTKVVRIDDKPLDRLAGLWGRLRAVLFTPDDLQLVKGGPAERRRYLDVALSQISSDFLFHLQRYNNALRQRNALLKRADLGAAALRENLAPWDTQMAEHGIPITQARSDFLAGLEPRAARLYEKIVSGEGSEAKAAKEAGNNKEGNNKEEKEYGLKPALRTHGLKPALRTHGLKPALRTEKLRLTYTNSLRLEFPVERDEARLRFHDLLTENLEDDLRRGQTGIGPHRDDFGVFLSGKAARDFGSQGQVRSCVLALRLAEALEMESRTGEPPILLLDDLASELDPSRKEHALALLPQDWQTFLTSTRRGDFPQSCKFEAVISLP